MDRHFLRKSPPSGDIGITALKPAGRCGADRNCIRMDIFPKRGFVPGLCPALVHLSDCGDHFLYPFLIVHGCHYPHYETIAYNLEGMWRAKVPVLERLVIAIPGSLI